MTDTNSWATPPSSLATFAELGTHSLGSKVRFVGIVFHYHVPSATLLLTARLPVQAHSETVAVNIEHVLNGAGPPSTLLRVGTLVDVVASVVPTPAKPARAEGQKRETLDQRDVRKARVHLQALTLREATGVTPDDYGEAVTARRDAMKRMRRADRQYELDGMVLEKQ